MYKNKYIYICMMIFTYMYIISIGIYISYPASGFNTLESPCMPGELPWCPCLDGREAEERW